MHLSIVVLPPVRLETLPLSFWRMVKTALAGQWTPGIITEKNFSVSLPSSTPMPLPSTFPPSLSLSLSLSLSISLSISLSLSVTERHCSYTIHYSLRYTILFCVYFDVLDQWTHDNHMLMTSHNTWYTCSQESQYSCYHLTSEHTAVVFTPCTVAQSHQTMYVATEQHWDAAEGSRGNTHEISYAVWDAAVRVIIMGNLQVHLLLLLPQACCWTTSTLRKNNLVDSRSASQCQVAKYHPRSIKSPSNDHSHSL